MPVVEAVVVGVSVDELGAEGVVDPEHAVSRAAVTVATATADIDFLIWWAPFASVVASGQPSHGVDTLSRVLRGAGATTGQRRGRQRSVGQVSCQVMDPSLTRFPVDRLATDHPAPSVTDRA